MKSLGVLLLLLFSVSVANSTDYDHWVTSSVDGGSLVILEDHSVWGIDAIDRIKTLLWLPTDNIRISNENLPLYPYELRNERTKDAVNAKYMGRP